MAAPDDTVLIVGAGHAGDAAAAHLRQYGYQGRIILLGEEIFAPYHRPPLSKAWLKGETDAAALTLRGADFYQRQNIDLRLNTRVHTIDRARRQIVLADGQTVPYSHLILATGARPRPLAMPGAGLAHVHMLRTRSDADRLRAALRPGTDLAIIGGGYIGLEIAASARALDIAVTVIERESRLLARVASPPLAEYFQRLHTEHGVTIRLDTQIAAITPGAVRLANGAEIPAGCVVIGVGAVPNTALAEAAGLDCANGITVDATARTADPAIFAIGDCASRPVPRYGRQLRLESVPNALEMAKQAAAAITGRAPSKPEIPWFWSDQYAARLQIAGLLVDVATTAYRFVSNREKFAAFHLGADGAPLAVEAVNAAEEFMAGRLMIARRTLPARAALADPTIPMKTILA